MFLAVARMPDVADALERAARATGVDLVDVRRRMTGVLPRVLMVDSDREAVLRARAALEVGGFQAFAFDPSDAPGDRARLVARVLALTAEGLEVMTGLDAQTRHRVPADAIELFQRGTRAVTRTETATTQERKLSIGRAVLTAGAVISRRVDRTTTSTVESRERFLLIHRRDGGADVILYEQKLDYRFLGAALQPVSHANFEATIVRIRALAPEVAIDDRVSRPGFVSGLPACSADPVDVALHLVHLAHA